MTDVAAKPPAPRGTYREAVSRLRLAQKPKAQTPAYLRFVNRRLGGWLAAAAFVRGWTPNLMTTISALLSLAGIVVLAACEPGVAIGVLVAVLLAAGYAFDSADGQLARLRGGGSPAGEWLDHVVDTVKACLLHSATLISLLRFGVAGEDTGASLLELSLPLIFLTGTITLTFATMLRDQLVTKETTPPSAGRDSITRGLVLLPIDYGLLCLAYLLLGFGTAFVLVYGVLAVFHLLFVARLLVRTHQQLSTV